MPISGSTFNGRDVDVEGFASAATNGNSEYFATITKVCTNPLFIHGG